MAYEMTASSPDMGEQVEEQVDEIDFVEAKEFVLACQKDSEDTYRDQRVVWDKCWDAYRCYQDYSNKETWQAQVYMPELHPAIEKATSAISRILFKPEDFFDFREGVAAMDMPTVQNPMVEGQKAATGRRR